MQQGHDAQKRTPCCHRHLKEVVQGIHLQCVVARGNDELGTPIFLDSGAAPVANARQILFDQVLELLRHYNMVRAKLMTNQCIHDTRPLIWAHVAAFHVLAEAESKTLYTFSTVLCFLESFYPIIEGGLQVPPKRKVCDCVKHKLLCLRYWYTVLVYHLAMFGRIQRADPFFEPSDDVACLIRSLHFPTFVRIHLTFVTPAAYSIIVCQPLIVKLLDVAATAAPEVPPLHNRVMQTAHMCQ